MDARKEVELKVPPSGHSGDRPPYPTIDPKDVDVPNLPPDDTERGGSAAGGERNWSTIPMGAPSDSTSGEVRSSSTTSHLSPSWRSQQKSEASQEGHPATMPFSSQDPYISASPVANRKNTMDTVRNVLGRWGKKVNDATKKAEVLAENVWQHLKTGPSVADTAMGRIAQGTKVLAEGGYEKIFQQTFETLPGEKLQNTYACYLSTSAGPIIGIFYLSSAKLAFCSDNPLPYKAGDKTEWSYYKVVIPLHQLKSINTSASKANPAEKYIQVTSIDNHEFWFMGFVSYDGAVEALENALAEHRPQRA